MTLFHHNPEVGKGDVPRIADRAAYRESHERIYGKRRLVKGGRYVWLNGRWRRIKKGAVLPGMRVCDNKRIPSVTSGVAPAQAEEMNRRFGHLGVAYDRRTGDAVYADRSSKLRVLKARGYHDRDEVRG